MGCLFAAVYFLWTLFYLIIVWPIRVIIALFAWIFTLIAYFPIIFILLAITALMIPWTRYHDSVVENVEFALRCRITPVWIEVVRPFVNLFRIIWNPLICWWNALQWFAFGWMQEVVWPIAIDGGILDTITKLGIFLNIFVRDFVAGYVLSGDFLQERVYLDGPLSCGFIGCTSMCDAWIDFWQAWQNLVCEFCQDLCKVWALQGVLNPLLFIPYLGQLVTLPILNPLALMGSNQMADRQFWCFLENSLNLIFELLRIAWRVFVQLITIGDITERPDGRQFWKFACDAFTCYVRSMENLAQLFVDCFLPFELNIAERPLEPDPLNRLGMFCMLDTAFCILARSVDVLFRMLIQIDRVVQYPADPYFEEIIVEDWKAILNLYAEPSRFNDIIVAPYPLPTLGNPIFEGLTITDNYISTTDPLSPNFGMVRLDQCICVFIQRLICDPSNPDIPCFDQGIGQLFMDAMFDFCCLTNILARIICDIFMGMLELLLSFTSPQKFFFFVDRMPYLRIFKENVVDVVDCLVDGFSFIPDVGFCLKQIFVQIVRFVLCIAEFLIRVIFGLITLPYFLIELTNPPMYVVDNFITEPNLAKDTFIDIIDQFVGERPDSFINCLCYLLNSGLPIPPLTINGFCPSCTPTGFVPPPMILKKDDASLKRASGSFFNENFIHKSYGSSFSSRITPILVYGNHSLTPVLIRDNIIRTSNPEGIGLLPNGLRKFDDYVVKRSNELINQWRKERECRRAIQNDVWLKDNHPETYAKKIDLGRLESQMMCGNVAHGRLEDLQREYEERLQTRPPQEPLYSNCTGTPMFPDAPPCFDICCIFKSVFRLAGEILSFLARFINSLAQEWDETRPGNTPQFPYFLGQNCLKDENDLPLPGCFEHDIRILVQRALDPVVCICRLIELLIPIIPQAPRPDLCCAITFLADLIGCILQTFINAIKALALDGEISQQVLQLGLTVCDIGTNDMIGSVDVGVLGCSLPSCDPGTTNMVMSTLVPAGYCRVLACDFGTDDTIFGTVYGVGLCNAGEDGDGIPFTYFNSNFFEQDIDILLEITVAVVDCLCNLFNAVFPMKSLSNGVFDPCCIAMSAIRAATAVIRLLLGIIINLATLDAGGFCYWRIDPSRCAMDSVYPNPNGLLSEIGFVKQVDAAIASILSDQGGPCTNSPTTGGCAGTSTGDQGMGGILGCLCSIISAILPVRLDPTQPVGTILNDPPFSGEENCPILDFCCLFRQLGFAIQDAASFAVQGLAALWQEWIPTCDIGTNNMVNGMTVPVGQCVLGSPEPRVFIRYFFCDETAPGAKNCGQIFPILEKLLNFLIGCPCQFFSILDAFLDQFFPIGQDTPIFQCFCGPQNGAPCIDTGSGGGLLCSTRDLLEVIIQSFLDFIRIAFSDVPGGAACAPNNPGCTQADIFWSPPSGGGFLDTNNDVTVVSPQIMLQRTWASNFFGPIADSFCRFAESALCFFNAFFGLPCPLERNRVLKSAVRWAFELAIRILAFVEGIIKVLFYEPTDDPFNVGEPAPNTASFGGPASSPNSVQVTAESLGGVISNLLNVFVDLLIADSSTLCGFVPGSFGGGGIPIGCACHGAGWMLMGDICVNMAATPSVRTQCVTPGDPTICEPGMMGCPEDLRCVPDRCYVAENPSNMMMQITCDIPDCGMCDVPPCSSDPGCKEKPLDGILMALFRYIQCFLGRGGFGAIMQPLIWLSSIFWQIIGAIIRFLVALFIFLFSLIQIFQPGCECHNTASQTYIQGFNPPVAFCYPCNGGGDPLDCSTTTQPSSPLVLCSIFQVWDNLLAVFGAFFAIFEQFALIVPPALKRDVESGDVFHHHDIERNVPYVDSRATDKQRLPQFPKRSKRVPRQEYRARAHAMRGRMIYEPQNALDMLAEAMFDYDVSDCFDDPIACTCRNMHMTEMCTWDPDQGVVHTKRDQPVTVEDVMVASNHHFGDSSETVCGHVIKSCASMTWDSIPDSEKIEWVQCMELRFQGERMNDMFAGWPRDFFYNKDGVYELTHNVLWNAKREVAIDDLKHHAWKMSQQKSSQKRKRFNGHTRETWNHVLGNITARWPVEKQNILQRGKIKNGMFIKPVLQLDQYEMKYRSGYYHWLVEGAYHNWKIGNWKAPSMKDSLQHLHHQTKQLYKTVRYAPYHKVVDSSVSAFHATKDVFNTIQKKGISNAWNDFKQSRFNGDHVREAKLQNKARRKMVRDAFFESPFYKWWQTPIARTSPLKTLYNHVSKAIERNRKGLNGKRWFEWDHAYLKIARHVKNRLFNGTYSQEKLDNWEAVKRPMVRAYSRMFPHHVTRDMEERFLINCNCRLIDDSFALVKFLVEYCVGEFVDNLPPIQRNKIHPELRIMADNGWFINHPNVITKEKIEIMKRDGTHDPELHYLEKWQRARVVHPKQERIRAKDIPKRMWRRIMMSGQPFDLFDWFLCFIEDLFDSTISQDVADFIMDLQAWLENDNTDYLAGPVGLKYWILFFWRCDFPLNLNCSIGIGLEAALGKVLMWSIIIFVGGSLLFPATLMPLIAFGAFVFYVIVVPMVAWHYSPRCWLMFPTMAFGVTTLIPPGMNGFTDFLIRLGEGVTIQGIPWPAAFPAFPECFWDEIIDLFDTWLTTCYDFLEEKGLGWILPLCMINGEVCPTCDIKIDVANCADVGLRDGIQNLIFILNYLFPDLCQYIVQNIASTCLLNGCISDAFPFDFQYVIDLFDSFKNANETQMCRFWWCFWATLPSIAFFILLGILLFSLLGFIVPLIFDLFGALWQVAVAGVLLVTSTGNVPGDETDVNESVGISSRIGSRMPRSAIGAFLEDKEERKSRRRRVVEQQDNYITGTLGRWISSFAIKPMVKKLKKE